MGHLRGIVLKGLRMRVLGLYGLCGCWNFVCRVQGVIFWEEGS